MADITSSDFKKLIEAQQETTRQLMTAEERAASDAKKAEINDKRVEGGRKAWETRQANATDQGAKSDKNGEKAEGKQTTFLGKIATLFQKDSQQGAADAEDDAKDDVKDSKMLGYLKSTAGFLGGIAKSGTEKVKGGLKGFSKFLFGGLAIAALAFLDNPKFKEIMNTILDVIIPALAYLYDNIIKPLALYIGGKLNDLFEDIKSYIDGDKGIGSVLTENIGIIAGIVTALAPNLVFGALKLGVTGLVKGVMLLPKAVSLITAGFTAVKTFMMGTLLPAITGFMVPLLPIIAIAAGIALAIYSLKQAFDDFMFELEATGSIWEATKTGIVSVISNILGLPFDLLKDGVSYIIGKIGDIFGLESFTNASKAMDEFSFVDTIKEGLTFMGDAIAGLFNFIVDFVQKIIRKIPFKGDDIANALFGTREEQEAAKKAKAEEQKQFELNRIALKEQQKLEKEASEAEKLKKVKEQQVQASSALVDPRSLAGPMPSQAAPIMVNAPTSTNVNAPNTTNMSTTSTSMINTDRVFDKLSAIP